MAEEQRSWIPSKRSWPGYETGLVSNTTATEEVEEGASTVGDDVVPVCLVGRQQKLSGREGVETSESRAVS